MANTLYMNIFIWNMLRIKFRESIICDSQKIWLKTHPHLWNYVTQYAREPFKCSIIQNIRVSYFIQNFMSRSVDGSRFFSFRFISGCFLYYFFIFLFQLSKSFLFIFGAIKRTPIDFIYLPTSLQKMEKIERFIFYGLFHTKVYTIWQIAIIPNYTSFGSIEISNTLSWLFVCMLESWNWEI